MQIKDDHKQPLMVAKIYLSPSVKVEFEVTDIDPSTWDLKTFVEHHHIKHQAIPIIKQAIFNQLMQKRYRMTDGNESIKSKKKDQKQQCFEKKKNQMNKKRFFDDMNSNKIKCQTSRGNNTKNNQNLRIPERKNNQIAKLKKNEQKSKKEINIIIKKENTLKGPLSTFKSPNKKIDIKSSLLPIQMMIQTYSNKIKALFDQLTKHNPFGLDRIHFNYIQFSKFNELQLQNLQNFFKGMTELQFGCLNFINFKKMLVKYNNVELIKSII